MSQHCHAQRRDIRPLALIPPSLKSTSLTCTSLLHALQPSPVSLLNTTSASQRSWQQKHKPTLAFTLTPQIHRHPLHWFQTGSLRERRGKFDIMGCYSNQWFSRRQQHLEPLTHSGRVMNYQVQLGICFDVKICISFWYHLSIPFKSPTAPICSCLRCEQISLIKYVYLWVSGWMRVTLIDGVSVCACGFWEPHERLPPPHAHTPPAFFCFLSQGKTASLATGKPSKQITRCPEYLTTPQHALQHPKNCIEHSFMQL